jgi:protein ImuB
MQRIVFVSLPLWPIERLEIQTRAQTWAASSHNVKSRGQDSRQDDAPLALIDQTGSRGLIVHACNARALAEGIREGEALADVRARVPGLRTHPADPVGDQAALEALALWCGRYGPAVNTHGPRGLWIDVSGVAHLFGGEAELLADLARRLAGFGLTAHLGLASTLAAAHAIACFAPGRRLYDRIVPRQDAAPILANLPVAALRLEAAPLLLLQRLGLKRIGQLYDLPRAALKRRFPSREAAHAVMLRLDQALGHTAEPLTTLRAPPEHTVRRAFSEPLISNEGLFAALTDMIDELCAIFAAHHIGARRLTLILYRSDGTYFEQTIGFSAPTGRPAHIRRLLTERLERIQENGAGREDTALLGLGIDALVLAVERTEALVPLQTGMLTASGSGSVSSTASLAALVDRLANRLGPQRVYRLSPCASHIPERAQKRITALAFAAEVKTAAHKQEFQWPVRALPKDRDAKVRGPPRPCLLLSPPEPILVTAEIPEGPPARFTWRRLTRRIVVAEGPERIAPEWWREFARRTSSSASGSAISPISLTRDYYRIEDDSGARYWVFRDGLFQDRGEGERADGQALPRWYVHGLYA